MRGLGISAGIGIGKAFVYKEPELNISKEHISDPEAELQRLQEAISKAAGQIDDLYEMTLKKTGKKEADVFAAHRMFLEDPEYLSYIKEKILGDRVNSEWALREAADFYTSLFEAMEDEYMRARAADIEDVSNRLLRILSKAEQKELLLINEKAVIVAEDLAPSDTAQINKDMVAGIVIEAGGRTSHTAIMARTMNIPLVCGLKNITDIAKQNDFIIINGNTGEVIINPTKDQITFHEKEAENIKRLQEELNKMKGQESISKDGYKVEVLGNIGTCQDVDIVMKNDGEGVGLYRTEFLYMHNDRLPTEEEQLAAYKIAAEKLGKKPLIIRTLDVGGDKGIPYLSIPEEMNPFLGYRAIRFCLDMKEIFAAQLRAILRASAYGNVKIMFPMISGIEEVRRAKAMVEEVKAELRKENLDFNEDIEIGIMVEIPSVAIHSRAFAKEVDFFSIGTNDLIQYTLAVDRGNQKVGHLYNQFHPAVLSLIKMTIDNGHAEGIRVGMCGEAAGDERMIPLLLAMGLDEFSMNASQILKARHVIKNTSKEAAEGILNAVLELPTAPEIESCIDENIP